MLTVNINVTSLSDIQDGLANGSMGKLIAVIENQDGSVKNLVVKFDKSSTGETARECYPAVSRKYPGGTVIGKKELEYSLSRNKSLVSSTAKLIQFPIIAAHAVTGW